jgi:hypothetical protein
MKTSLRFSLNTALKLMFVGALLVWANTQPALNFYPYPYTENSYGFFTTVESEVYTREGYGWPVVWMHPEVPTGVSWGNLAINLFVAVFVLALSGIFFEAKHWKKWLALLLALGFGCFIFIACYAFASSPVISPVSLSRNFKPWWQNWRISGVAFVLAWTLTTLSFLNEIYLNPKLKLHPQNPPSK